MSTTALMWRPACGPRASRAFARGRPIRDIAWCWVWHSGLEERALRGKNAICIMPFLFLPVWNIQSAL